MSVPVIRTLAVLLICLTASAGCNQANNAELSKVKAEAEAAKADLAKANARADAAEAELATLKVAKPEPAKQPEEVAERKAAEWVVQSGGTVRISTNGVIGEYPKDGELPDRGCRVISVDLLEPGRNGRLSNEGVKYLADLEYITSLHLTGGSASGAL